MIDIKQKSQKPSWGNFGISGFLDFVKGRDDYGHPIVLNYKGDDTFKTLPGGILSILMKLLLVLYGLLRINAMHRKIDW